MKNPEFTCRLSDFINSHLGDSDYRVIEPHLAEQISIVLAKNKDCELCHIQWPSEELGNGPQTSPVLWKYSVWAESSERWLSAKEKSRVEREARFILQANCDRISRLIAKKYYLDLERALSVAYGIMRRRDKCVRLIKEEIGVTKLVEKVEEI